MSDPAWAQLSTAHLPELVDELKRLHGGGSFAITARELSNRVPGTTEEDAQTLLMGAGDWLQRREQPGEVDAEFPDEPASTVTFFVWEGAPPRDTQWLLLVHGMNTKGLWQEYLSFEIGLWQGKNVPTFAYKYGWIVLGVLMPWRRTKLLRALQDRIIELSQEPPKFNLGAKPDVVCHSFGTWLVGHALLQQLGKVNAGHEPDFRLGRVILTGSILRPDFDWASLQEEGLVEDVLNHYGTRDRIVPLAHWTIVDSGPSGRRGFDSTQHAEVPHQVLNVVARDFAHSQLLAADKDRYDSYSKTWKLFLSNPEGQASRNLPLSDPARSWVEAWWPLRGTLFPFVAVPVLMMLLAWGLISLGGALSSLAGQSSDAPATALKWLALCGAGPLVVLYVGHVLRMLIRRI